MKNFSRFLAIFCCLFFVRSNVLAISITWELQDPGNTFFTSTAQATLNQAAADVSAAITSTLNSLTQSEFFGVNGSTTFDIYAGYGYLNPDDGTTSMSVTTFSLASNEFHIYVGSRALAGATVGVGGPAGLGYSYSGGGYPAEWVGAVADAESQFNSTMMRGGPQLGSSSGSTTLGGTTANFTLDYGYAYGSLAFDDTATWHFDYNTMPTAGTVDFYSVAVHEILHAIGFGIGSTWDEHVAGTDWTGMEVIGLLGTGVDVLAMDEAHIASGLQGNPFINGEFQTGVLQDAIMTPSLTDGTRRYITNLDMAFLNDMGYQTIPEPSAIFLFGLGVMGLVLRRQR
ncbi:MAG: PEP-CTERM sorting domain-containing protein [Chthoniobacterales bacterium]